MVLGCLIGCASASPPVAKQVPYAGKPWLKLVEPDNEWTLAITEVSGHFDASGIHADKHATGKVHCKITALDHVGEAVVSHLKCDKPYDALSLSGQWVQQPNGLYHPLIPVTQPDDLSTLLDDDLLLLDPPHERDSTHSTESSVHRVEAAHDDHGNWCLYDKTSAVGLKPAEFGDRRSFIVCMSPEVGIVAASEFETIAADKTWHAVQIGANPPLDLEDPTHPVTGDE